MRFVNTLFYIITSIYISLFICELYLCIYVGMTSPKLFTDSRHFEQDEVDFVNNLAGWGTMRENKIDSEDKNIIINIWPDGMRECRDDQNKKANFKAAFVGCSYTFGIGVQAEDTMVWRLNERYPDAVFDNWAVSGWGPAQMYLRIEHLLSKDKYDLIVYNAIYDHMFRTYVPRAYGRLVNGSEYIAVPYANWNIFGHFIIHSEADLRWPLEFSLLSADFGKRVYYGYKTKQYEKFYSHDGILRNRNADGLQRAEECFAELVNRMDELCRSKNTNFLLCVLEDYGDHVSANGSNNVITDNPAIRCELINIDMPNGEAHKPENRVLNIPTNHPNKNVHKYWADEFSKWFDRRYKLNRNNE